MDSSNQQSRVEEAPSVVVEQLFSYEDEKLPQTAIFGPFWRVASLLGLSITNSSYVDWCGAFICKDFWVATQMGDFKLWSVNWAYSTLLFIFSLHSFACFVVLNIENVYMLRQMQHNESSVPSSGCLFYDTSLFNGKIFRNSMLGPNSMPLLVFDTLILVWASLVSSEKNYWMRNQKKCVNEENGRASSIVSNKSIIQFNNNNELSYQEQHQASLNDPQILTAFDSQLIDFISLIKHCNTKTEPLITISFMCAMFSYVVSTFAVRSFKHDFNPLQNITFYNWMMLSLMFVFITLVPLAKLHTKMRDTKNLILLEKAIWKEYDPEVFAIASNMVKRIDMVDYESRLFSAIRVTSAFFNLLLLIVPIFMDYVLTPQR
uniref:Gustatory receptor n=1 Tax=Ditylenchus dipsaci TaxID=166011 RepID=A0A915DB27_9BILA